ncbi:MAG: CDP-alcohol phosphatidyltransferase family protein [Dehalococcoidia bacterium]|jgi:CDP-diacylglycerol--glycerol-3-phosphate 3-phosphatidyltransferase
MRRAVARGLTQPAVRVLARTGVTPDILTWFGFAVILGAAALIGTGHPFAGGFVVLAAGFFDILDGALARHTGKVTKFGGVLDSTLDRLSDAALLVAILFYLENTWWLVLLVFLTMVSSLLVSYIRARAEAVGLDCQTGIFTRSERIIVLALGLLLSGISNALVIALAVIAAFSFFTAGQRLVYVWRHRS